MDARERMERIEALFHQALELPSGERDTFVARAADDESVLAEVAELLAADDRTGGFLRPPSTQTLGSTAPSLQPELAPGARLGVWRVGEALAAGGMGTVYRATRADREYEQAAALKIVRGAADSAEARERFLVERQTLARLRHPAIARLLDGGTTDGGVPYLVMELIEGQPIDRFCDQRRLSIPERLQLFLTVCAAVEHAHRNLIVHRDLKPSNILVDDSGAPKLVDFGIAKELGQDRLDEPRTRTRLMTPEYASPEQVRGEAVTTGSDVYSLGIVLYEVLTGTRPYRSDGRLPHELERAICEDDPQKPSTAVVQTAESPDSREIAAFRSTPPRDLKRQLEGDLDTIVLKALHKSPLRRYSSVNQLAEDVRRYLEGMPVLARPSSWTYRAGKFVRRNRLASAAAAALGVSLLLGAFGISYSAYVAHQRLKTVFRLSDLSDLVELERRADQLWPADPSQAGEMERWLVAARELAGHQGEHRAALQDLREGARPYGGEARRADRASHARLPEYEDLLIERQGLAAQAAQAEQSEAESQLEEVERRLEELDRQLSLRRTWSFPDRETQWQHDKLAELVPALEAFAAPEVGTLAQVERRFVLAGTLRQRTVVDHALAWERAIESIADAEDCPAYRGLRITPQVGLVPLDRNPEAGLWEFAHLPTGEPPSIGADGSLAVEEQTGMVFVLLPGGKFRMGASGPSGAGAAGEPNVDPLSVPAEAPPHDVTLEPFFISKHEMTQGQWERFTGSNPSLYVPGQLHGAHVVDLRHPVEHVSWLEATRVLSQLGLRLPTEAQWEYAARGGTSTPWWTGADRTLLEGAINTADAAAISVNAPWRDKRDVPGLDDGHVVHAPVDAFHPNPFGLHNVCGNVWEWTADHFGLYDRPVRAGDGLRLLRSGDRLVARGGSYRDGTFSARSSHRGPGAAEYNDSHLGLRAARSLEP